MAKKILVVSSDALLLLSRALIAKHAGYEVRTATTDDDAMRVSATEHFDLVLMSRQANDSDDELAQRLRKRYPDLMTLEIAPVRGRDDRIGSTRIVDSLPISVVTALAEMLDQPKELSLC